MAIEHVTFPDGLVRALSFQKAGWKLDGVKMGNLQARETPLAKGLLKWLFACIYAYVSCEMSLSSKALVAYGAADWRCLCLQGTHNHIGCLCKLSLDKKLEVPRVGSHNIPDDEGLCDLGSSGSKFRFAAA